MPSFRRRASVIDADRVDEPPQDPGKPADTADALSLAEEAEAEAAEAEATAAAARARARAIRLRRQAAAESKTSNSEDAATDVDTDTDTDSEDAVIEADTAEVVETAPVSDDDTVAQTPEEEEPARSKRWSVGRVLKLLAAAIAVIGTVALVTLSVLMVLQHRHVQQEQRLNAEYEAAARQSVVTLMSLDFNKAKDDVQRIIDNSTGQFKDDFQNQAEDFIKVAQDAKVVTEVTVNATGVRSMTKDTATVLVSATSRVTNTSGAKQEPRSWRLAVDLQRDGDQIKMSKVEFVP